MIPGPQTVATEIRSLSPVSRQDQLRLGDLKPGMRACSHSKCGEVLTTIPNAHILPKVPISIPPPHVTKALSSGLRVNRTHTHTHTLLCQFIKQEEQGVRSPEAWILGWTLLVIAPLVTLSLSLEVFSDTLILFVVLNT